MSFVFTTVLRGKVSNMPTVPHGNQWTPISSVGIRRCVGYAT